MLQRKVTVPSGRLSSSGRCLDLERRSLLAILAGKARGIRNRKEVETVYPFWEVWRRMEWNGHQGGALVSPGEGKTGAVQAGGMAVEVLQRKERPTADVKRSSKAGNPTDALELASGR